MPKAVIETQRIGVSTWVLPSLMVHCLLLENASEFLDIYRSIKHVCTVLEANMNNDLKNLPERFHLEGVDVWLQRFEKKVGKCMNPSS